MSNHVEQSDDWSCDRCGDTDVAIHCELETYCEYCGECWVDYHRFKEDGLSHAESLLRAGLSDPEEDEY